MQGAYHISLTVVFLLSKVYARAGTVIARQHAFSFPTAYFPQRARSFSHFSSTYCWAASMVHSLPGLKQCLKRP